MRAGPAYSVVCLEHKIAFSSSSVDMDKVAVGFIISGCSCIVVLTACLLSAQQRYATKQLDCQTCRTSQPK